MILKILPQLGIFFLFNFGYFEIFKDIPFFVNNFPHFHAAIPKIDLQRFVSGDIEWLDLNKIGLMYPLSILLYLIKFLQIFFKFFKFNF